MLIRPLIASFVVLSLVGLVSAVWSFCDLPPPRLILKYGFPPTGGPTGRTMTIEGVEFVELKPGYFLMGSHFLCEEGDLLGRVCAVLRLPWGKQPRHASNECPPHWVQIGNEFWIARTELSNEQYERFDPNHGRDFYSPYHDTPVVYVSSGDAKAYCEWISKRGLLRARLPTEAEWEYACRAGSMAEYCFGNDEAKLGEYTWWGRSLRFSTRHVAAFRPNAWGIFDMHGNVSEWCEDTYHRSYAGAPADAHAWMEGGEEWRRLPDPRLPGGPEESIQPLPVRAIRGGNLESSAVDCRSARRSKCVPSHYPSIGFRPAGALAR